MTVMSRSALVHWGHNPAPDVAAVVIEHRGPGAAGASLLGPT